MKIVCLILNYNDAETTKELVLRVRGYAVFDRILVVDNASADDSYETLRQLCDERVVLLRSPRNGGYGAGNDLGIRFAAGQLGATHVLIANPDVSFSEDCVKRLARVFARHPEVGIAAPLMEQEGLGRFESAWPLHDFVRELLYMGPVSRRLFRSQVYYPDSYFPGKKAVRVDVVHGAMLMVAVRAYLACGGYDRHVFLYQEEMILGRRMKQAGYQTVLVLTERYRHRHSVSITKTYSEELDRQRLREKSVYYYLKEYLRAGPRELFAARLWFLAIRTEIRVFRALTFGRTRSRRSGRRSRM